MGAWSHQPFGNDTASDWACGLEETKGLSLIDSALDSVIEQGDEYLDASEAEEAVAAIEVIAKLLGKGSQSDAYTEKVDLWIESMAQEPSTELLNKAQNVIDRILADNSELLELWQDSSEFEEWHASILRLKAAVSR